MVDGGYGAKRDVGNKFLFILWSSRKSHLNCLFPSPDVVLSLWKIVVLYFSIGFTLILAIKPKGEIRGNGEMKEEEMKEKVDFIQIT